MMLLKRKYMALYCRFFYGLTGLPPPDEPDDEPDDEPPEELLVLLGGL